MNNEIVILSATRTPMGAFQGVFKDLPAATLGAAAAEAALRKAGIAQDQVDELLFGCVLPAGVGQAPARQVALQAGLAMATRCTTVSKVCGSGMKSVMLAHDGLAVGSCDIAIAGGMESMSQAPYLLPKARDGMRLGHGEVVDHMFFDGLQDARTGALMGNVTQTLADAEGIGRQAMDDFAVQSVQRAQGAVAEGLFKEEVVPVTVSSRKGDTVVDGDEPPGKLDPYRIPQLRPAFAKDGSITAANSSSIADGAAALLLTTGAKAQALGQAPLARMLGHASHALAPEQFPLAPAHAIRKLLDRLQWTVADVDLFEVNEAFAVVTMLAMRELNIEAARMNVNGGACALGHPIGASGARILVTLIHALRARGLKRGVAGICIGGGEATAIAVEV